MTLPPRGTPRPLSLAAPPPAFDPSARGSGHGSATGTGAGPVMQPWAGAGRAGFLADGVRLAPWVTSLGPPEPEPAGARRRARAGGVAAVVVLLGYLLWRVLVTLPAPGPARVAAWLLVGFETLPLLVTLRALATSWDLDAETPPSSGGHAPRVVVLVSADDATPEVLGPTVSAAQRLEPAHETWVLDDADRPWLARLCDELGVRHVTAATAPAGRGGAADHALSLLTAATPPGATGDDLVAVLECDQVPLPGFLTSTLAWFEDPEVGLVRVPTGLVNHGAFADHGAARAPDPVRDRRPPARRRRATDLLWDGSASVLRVSALRALDGLGSHPRLPDGQAALRLERLGWRTGVHHQTLVLGTAPVTPEHYLAQRRRSAVGALRLLVRGRLWRAAPGLPLRRRLSHVAACLAGLTGLAVVACLALPAALLLTGAATSTASPRVSLPVLALTVAAAGWGRLLLARRRVRWRTAVALSVLRLPIGASCLWWLLTRRDGPPTLARLEPEQPRRRGRAPALVLALLALTTGVLGYAVAGLSGLVPARGDAASVAVSGGWLALALVVLAAGVRRSRAERFASSRRTAHRYAVRTPARVDGAEAELVDVSVGGAAVRFARLGPVATGEVLVELPGAEPMVMLLLQVRRREDGTCVGTLMVPPGDWQTLCQLSLWMFHTPPGAVPGLPDGVPAVALVGG